jgi:hypothetical protein
MTDLDQRSVDWLRDPDKWVHRSVCPVKRYRAGKVRFDHLEVGLVVAHEPSIVYIKNLFMMESGSISPQLADCQRYEYESIEALVRDGWMVD